MAQKRPKISVLDQKIPVFLRDFSLAELGGTTTPLPPPPLKEQLRQLVFDGLPMSVSLKHGGAGHLSKESF